MKKIKLINGVEVPILGFGTYRITDLKECENAVLNAINLGYRHIDTAQLYMNEEAVGNAIIASKVDRKEIFVTTKIWVENISYEGVMRSFEGSLKRLKTNYVDLLLIHQPLNDIFGAWRAMEELLEQNKVRAIGVSNFPVDRIINIKLFNKIFPMVNQIEINPFFQRKNTINSLKKMGIALEAWAPLAQTKNKLFDNEILKQIAKKYNKTPAQIVLRWLIQNDVISLVKSVNINRMKENIDLFDFELDSEDIKQIESLDTNQTQFYSVDDPNIMQWMHDEKLGRY